MQTIQSGDLEKAARRRVDMKIGFYTHALVFVLVNLGLFVQQPDRRLPMERVAIARLGHRPGCTRRGDLHHTER